MDDALYFDGSPQTRRGRDLAVNARVSVHLEDGANVVILEGEAQALSMPPQTLAIQISAGYRAKYAAQGDAPEPSQWDKGGLYVMKPRLVFAWTKFPDDATRWQIKDEG